MFAFKIQKTYFFPPQAKKLKFLQCLSWIGGTYDESRSPKRLKFRNSCSDTMRIVFKKQETQIHELLLRNYMTSFHILTWLICEIFSSIVQQIAYEYARRKANLVLVARREHRLFGIRENCRVLGAKQVLIIAADVVKEEDCKRFISDTISYFGQCIYSLLSLNSNESFRILH